MVEANASERGRLIWKLADLLEENLEEFAELESLDNGKPLKVARAADVPLAVDLFRYMAGWATKIEGQHHSDFGALHAGRKISGLHVAGACRRSRPDYSVEFSAADGGLETGAGAGYGQHRRFEAGGADPAYRAASG